LGILASIDVTRPDRDLPRTGVVDGFNFGATGRVAATFCFVAGFAAADFVTVARATGRAAFAPAVCLPARAWVARSVAAEALPAETLPRGAAAFAAGFFALAFAATDLAAVDFEATRAAGLAALLTEAERAACAFVAAGFLALLEVGDFEPARAIVALALRDFSVFLTDDIRAHSFLVLLRTQDSEILQCSKNCFAAWESPHLGMRRSAPSDDHPTPSSVNLGPQAIAACREEFPNAPAKHWVNAIRMIRAGPIVKLKYHTKWEKSKICGQLSPENRSLCRKADAARGEITFYV
jgi:hypothetical protein